MRNKTTVIVSAALLCVFGYFLWEHFSEKNLQKGPSEKKIKRLTQHHPQDGIDLAMQYEFEITKDPALNRVPRERLLEAENYRLQKLSSLNRTTTAVSGISWIERGPNNVGGRTRALLYDANDAGNGYKKVFAGSVSGGLWVTNDITVASPTWNKIDDFMGNLAISTLAQDPSNTLNIYAGTGEGWFNSDAVQGLGIWKSTDGGTSFSQLGSTNNSGFYFVQKIVVTSTGIVLAATRNGVQRSTNGGTSWATVLAVSTGAPTSRAADIEIGNDGTIYASMGIFSTGGIYRSTDNGATWSQIYSSTGNENRIELACAPSNANIVYALVHDQDGADGIAGNSDDDGIKKIMSTSNATGVTPTWTTLTTPAWCDQGSAETDFTRGQAWYDLVAAVDPSNANTVYIGGIDMLKTTDGGTNWTQITQWASGCSVPQIHADIHAIAFKPGSTTEFIVGNDGGIFRSTDAGVSFASKISSYNVTQYYACAIHPATTNYFLAGSQDNGTQKFTAAGINSTTDASGGDGGFCHIDQDDGNIQISAYVFNNYFVSLNGGSSFSSRFFNNSGGFINSTDYDNNANILYAGSSAGNFFRWNDPSTAGTSTNTVSVAQFAGASVRHVAVSPITANRVYFGLSNGDVVSVDNANTGTSIAGTVIRAGTGNVSCIAIDPANEDHMLVTYSNFGVSSVFESFNATQASPTWTDVEGNLPDMPVRWAMFDPRNSDWALIATDLGVWSTDDLNGVSTDWDPTNTDLANVRVDMLQYRSSDRTLAAATHGRGLFTATVPNNPLPVSLLTFTGKLQGENVKLDWSTSSEYNSKVFEIESSFDGNNFKKIGSVAAAGNSNGIRNYTFTDPKRAIEYNYYRLKMIDIDNTFVYSDVVLVKRSFGKQDVYLAGNPFTDKINIQFAKIPNSNVSINIYDLKGSKIYEAGYINYMEPSLQIDISNKLARGIYSIKVETGGQVYTLKAMKQ